MLTSMSVGQVLEEIGSWSQEDREKLASKLEALAILDDPEYMAEMQRRSDEIKAGSYLTGEQLKVMLKERRGLEFVNAASGLCRSGAGSHGAARLQ